MDINADVPDDEPTPEELAEIEGESELIAAELAMLDAELRILSAGGDSSDVDWQRLRRAMRDVINEAAELYDDDRDRPEDDVA
jgi:hypothetical protein